MNVLLKTLSGYQRRYLRQDLLSGLVIAAVSIPISMGYAQIAGLPAAYGLYGSVLPVLFFALFSTSPQFIFGVDAAPAAMVGSMVAGLGIPLGSEDAIAMVPLLAFYAGVWLLLFALLKAGKVLNFISAPVMGGFISGICCTIILMQVPKLMGHAAGTGELLELLEHIHTASQSIHWLSLELGAAALTILLLSKRFLPKFPMAILIMAAGAAGSARFDLAGRGVPCLSPVVSGLPGLHLPDFTLLTPVKGLGMSLSVAIVIMAETLLAENSFALRNDYQRQPRDLKLLPGQLRRLPGGLLSGKRQRVPLVHERAVWRTHPAGVSGGGCPDGCAAALLHWVHSVSARAHSDRHRHLCPVGGGGI